MAAGVHGVFSSCSPQEEKEGREEGRASLLLTLGAVNREGTGAVPAGSVSLALHQQQQPLWGAPLSQGTLRLVRPRLCHPTRGSHMGNAAVWI